MLRASFYFFCGHSDLPCVVGVDPLPGMVAKKVHARGEGALRVLGLESRGVPDVRRDVVGEQPHLLALGDPRAFVLANDDVVRLEQVRELFGLEDAEVRGVALRWQRWCRQNLIPLYPRGRLGDMSVLEVGLPWKRRHVTRIQYAVMRHRTQRLSAKLQKRA